MIPELSLAGTHAQKNTRAESSSADSNLKSTRLSAARVSNKIQHHKALVQQSVAATRIAAIECR